MKKGRVSLDLLTPLDAAASVEDGLSLTLRQLLELTGALGGTLVFDPPRGRPIGVTARRRPLSAALERWLSASAEALARGGRVTPLPSSGSRARALRMRRVPLGANRPPVGELILLEDARRRTRESLPKAFARELATTIQQVWQRHERTLRISVLNEITARLVSRDSLDDVFRGFVEGLPRLVVFDSVGVSLVDAERDEFEIIDVLGRATPKVPARDTRLPLRDTLLAELVATGKPLRVDDVTAPAIPALSRTRFARLGYRSVVLVPLVSRDGLMGAVTVASHRPAAFDHSDVEMLAELVRPLASAIEQRRLLDENRRRTEELAALAQTSQLITAQLDVASVLDHISRSVTALIGSTGCAIGLLNKERTELNHAAAHGFRTEGGRLRSIPVGEGIMGTCAASGVPIRVDDVPTDPRSARRDIDEREGIRAMLCVPLKIGAAVIGVISAFSTRPAAFIARHHRVLEAFADQAGVAIRNARLFEESVRRARETRALLEAGRAVAATLDVAQTMRVIMEQARTVLDISSCGIMTIDPASPDELVNVASLDLPPEMVGRIRVKVGEGFTGLAVLERRPVQSRDLLADARGSARYRGVQRETGFRSTLAVPLREGDRAIGALIVFRQDVHDFSPAEVELLVALADQAAIALEHARLYEQLEGMVAERTRELDAQKRFVEVVLETLPLGVFVLDPDLGVVRANREGAHVLSVDAGIGAPFAACLGDRAEPIQAFIREVSESRRIAQIELEMSIAGEARVVRVTAAPLERLGEMRPHSVVLIEDVTLAKRLERQMLLTERLTTAGRLASGVAHELNNPLATIAGCAEALSSRLRDGHLKELKELVDFPRYLTLIEEEAYRCKEITGSLLQFVREPGGRRASTDLNALVQKTVELLSHQSRFGGSRVLTELDAALAEVTVNEGQVRQVFLGLAANALEAMDGGGTLVIRTRGRRDEVEIEFEDEGPGIADEMLPRIFDPFFTTKPPGQGTGLGLAIAQGIVADHAGRIEVTSGPGKGSIFRVVLPR